jgi:hypothetical protein
LVSDQSYYLQYYDQFNQLQESEIEPDQLSSQLSSPRSSLFTPKALAQFRTGQLSFSDLEHSISERSFSFIFRQREQLDQAFDQAIKTALKYIPISQKQTRLRHQVEGHIIRIAIAYLAGRILEDKRFLGSRIPTNDPKELLNRIVQKINGFFRRTLDQSIPYLEEHLSADTNYRILQSLATYLGHQVTFALVDHRDVGILYERAIKSLPNNLAGQDWSDLQRHYTPVAIAEKMLELLPIERIRPEKRVIFDPAAGSGSLLLAGTFRLAGMTDIPENIKEKQNYLVNHVIGNDLDQYANLITQLRYILASESLSQENLFPFPAYFSHQDYEVLNINNLPHKPSIIIANPPFAEDGNTQKASRFVQKALSWLDQGDQFAFVLPQSFLTATTHGIKEARQLLTENCQIFEIWQLPENVVGVEAKQSVSIVLGCLNNSHKTYFNISRAIFSHAENKYTRENGFLGATWINSSSQELDSVTAPPINIKVPTIPLGNLFYIFNGVNPGNKAKIFPALSKCPDGISCKLNWRMKWRDIKRIWADPDLVPKESKWIRYGEKYLERSRPENAHLFDLPKILVSSRVNRGSQKVLAVQFDTTGLCPDNNVFCIVPIDQVKKYTKDYQPTNITLEELKNLDYKQQMLWLLGILSSELVNNFSLIKRGNRVITTINFCNLPLPSKVDHRIIEITRQILERDQNRLPIPEPDDLHIRLNELVEESYGNPEYQKISRTGTPTGLEEWKREKNKPTLTVFCEVLEVSQDKQKILLYINGLLDDEREKWIDILPEMPGWALDGTVFDAELSKDVQTFQELAKRPWSLRGFKHTSRPYLTDSELEKELGIGELL